MSNVGVEDSKSSTPLVALNDNISFFDLLIAVLWHSGLLGTFAAMGAAANVYAIYDATERLAFKTRSYWLTTCKHSSMLLPSKVIRFSLRMRRFFHQNVEGFDLSVKCHGSKFKSIGPALGQNLLQFIELRFKCFLHHRFLVLNAGWCDLHSHSSCFVGQRQDPQIENYI